MPGNTFLPVAGPAGTLISMLIGMAIMQAHIAKPIGLSVLTKTLLSILKL